MSLVRRPPAPSAVPNFGTHYWTFHGILHNQTDHAKRLSIHAKTRGLRDPLTGAEPRPTRLHQNGGGRRPKNAPSQISQPTVNILISISRWQHRASPCAAEIVLPASYSALPEPESLCLGISPAQNARLTHSYNGSFGIPQTPPRVLFQTL